MPKDFLQCVKDGGRVRTVSGPDKKHGLKEEQYVKYCYKDGESFRGEVKEKQSWNKNL